MTKLIIPSLATVAALALLSSAPLHPARAQEAKAAPATTVVAKVNGRDITEAELKLADAEIGSEVGNLPETAKRRILIEFLVENQLMAAAAEAAKLDSGQAFEERMQYWRRRALRDTYFANTVENGISDADARKFYDAQLANLKPEEEVHARHILVESEATAKEVSEKLAHGADFAAMAKEYSKDPGSKDTGGDLGFFAHGQMVPEFDDAAFKLQKGDISLPVHSQFGWHVIQVTDKRTRSAPAFDDVKDRIKAAMVHQKAEETVNGLRSAATIEYVDPAVRAMVESEKAAHQPKP